MEAALFDELLSSIEQAGAIRKGVSKPSREYVYEGKVLTEIREQGETVWRLDKIETSSLPTESVPNATEVKALRESMKQSQAGFAALLGISIDTVQDWEQGRRKPQGASKTLLRIVAKYPRIVLEMA